MTIKQIIIFTIIYNLIINLAESKINYKIIATVNNQAVTYFDLENEKKIIYLLNDNSKINESEIKEIAINNLIEDILKKKEIEKFNIKAGNNLLKKYYSNYLSQFEKKNTKIEEKTKELIFEKIRIGIEWKLLISELYRNKINININEINKKITDNEKKDTNTSKEETINNLKVEEINKKLDVYNKYHLIKIKKNALIRINK